MLYSAYRTDQYADPEGFMASLGLVFSQYPDDVIEYVTNPLTGIQRKSKFPPTIEEVVSACSQRMADKARTRRYRNWGKNEAVGMLEGPKNEDRPTYEELKSKYGDNWGIGVQEAKRKTAKPAPTIEQLRHHYKHYDLEFRPRDVVDEDVA